MLMQKLAAEQAQHEVQRGFLLHLVLGEREVILKLLAAVDEALLVRGDAFLVLDIGLDSADGVRGLALHVDNFVAECFAKSLHSAGPELDLWST
jgi:hypothetical protein